MDGGDAIRHGENVSSHMVAREHELGMHVYVNDVPETRGVGS